MTKSSIMIPIIKLKSNLAVLIALIACLAQHANADGVLCSLRNTLSEISTEFAHFDVKVIDSIAYVLDSRNGLQTFDVTNPEQPILLGSYDTPDWASRIHIEANLAYIADNTTGLIILDITDPSGPALVSTFKDDLSFRYNDVKVQDAIAYIADGFYGLILLDVSDPANPTRLGSFNTSGWAIDIELQGTTVFVSDSEDGLQILDASNPSTPTRITSIPTESSTQNTLLQNDTIYIADGHAGMKVYDVSDPSTPQHQGTFELTEFVHALAIEGTTLYVSDRIAGIETFDITIPNAPIQIGTFSRYALNPEQLAVSNSVAYIANNARGLLVLDVSSPSASPLLETNLTPERVHVQTNGSLAYTLSDQVLEIHDITNPTYTNPLSSIPVTGVNYGWTHSDSIIFIASSNDGIQRIDVTNPNLPIPLNTIDTPDLARDVAVVDDLLYVSDHTSLQIFDLSNPNSPVARGSLPLTGFSSSIKIDGDRAFIDIYNTGIMIIDISDPDFPTLITSIVDYPYFTDYEVLDKIIYLLDGSNKLRILDVSDPKKMMQLAQLDFEPTNIRPSSITIEEDIAYITLGYPGVSIVDLSNPLFPTPLARQANLDDAVDAAVSGNTAFVTGRANNDWNLQIFDISDCPPCAADLNNDTTLNFLDISAFLITYGNQDPVADFNADGSFNFLDVSEFLNAFAAGCP